MNLIIIFASGFILANAYPASQIFRRDVSHLDLSYLPPHIPQIKELLPPIEDKEHPAKDQLTDSPSNEYLPPMADVKEIPAFTEKSQDSTTVAAIAETEAKTETLPPPNDYLPPSADIKESEIPSNDYLPPINTGEDISEIPLEPFPKSNEIEENSSHKPILEEASGEIIESLNTSSEDTVKAADGYHYKKPDNIPDLFTPIEVNTDYLPPLLNGVVEIEGPGNGESIVLQNDGYHYRNIKRRF